MSYKKLAISFGSLGFAAVFGAIALSRVRGEEA